MTRPSDIADYLLAADFNAPEAALKAELIAGILARWPDVTRHDLEAGFEIAALESAARLADAVADQCDRTAIAIARATAANTTPM